jgi:hypothetical protein
MLYPYIALLKYLRQILRVAAGPITECSLKGELWPPQRAMKLIFGAPKMAQWIHFNPERPY